MNFSDALFNMQEGRRMVRPNWIGNWVCILPAQKYIWNIAPSLGANINANIYIPTIDDLKAEDWIVKTN